MVTLEGEEEGGRMRRGEGGKGGKSKTYYGKGGKEGEEREGRSGEEGKGRKSKTHSYPNLENSRFGGIPPTRPVRVQIF